MGFLQSAVTAQARQATFYADFYAIKSWNFPDTELVTLKNSIW